MNKCQSNKNKNIFEDKLLMEVLIQMTFTNFGNHLIYVIVHSHLEIEDVEIGTLCGIVQ